MHFVNFIVMEKKNLLEHWGDVNLGKQQEENHDLNGLKHWTIDLF